MLDINYPHLYRKYFLMTSNGYHLEYWYFIFRKPNSSPVIKHVTNTHNFLVGDSLDVVCLVVCLHAGDDDTNYFSLLCPPSLQCFENIAKSCLDSGYRPTVDVYLLKFELPIPGLWRALRTFTGPAEHPHLPPDSPLTYKLAGPEGGQSWGGGWYNSAGVGVVFCQPTVEI